MKHRTLEQSDAPEVTSESIPASLDVAPEPLPDRSFPIVGIGASAGGLAAFEAFFSAIPADIETGMAFVLVQHLAPDHKSILTELVRRYTRMQVHEVEDGMVVQPDCAYIIPPKLDMALYNGALRLLEPSTPRGLRLPIDFFFRSLAQDQHERAICVVLSGTGSDGTLGARAIKGEGGLVMAQDPRTAAYDGMPRSVIATGLTDFVLPPAEMPEQLMNYVAHAFGIGWQAAMPAVPKVEDALTRICILLRDQTTHDFSQYKQSTLIRRVERRMALHQIERQGDYVRYLQQDLTEIEALFHDLLIGVTSFFRDPDAFAVLEQDVIPRLFIARPREATVRIWVCGCSTGEEAYSIAILVKEHLDTLKQPFKVQIFASDVDARAITQARAGVYPANIAADVSPARLARFFVQDAADGSYRIHKSIRDLLVFSEHDLIQAPPFSRIDLISCRNLLIYLNGDLQKRLIPLFHYALNPSGILFLGNSETVGELINLFTPLNRKWKIYVRQDQLTSAPLQALGGALRSTRTSSANLPTPAATERRASRIDLRALTEQALLHHFNPVGILANSRGEILHIYGRTGLYLEPAPGDAALNLFSMAREGLRRAVTAALHRVVTSKGVVRLPGLRVRTNGDFTSVNLTVHTVQGAGDAAADLYVVVLEAVQPLVPEALSPARPADGEAPPPTEFEVRITELEQELRAKEEYLQTTLEEMETANEELKSTNEEMQSVNEELQSTNEELETSKEELQSVNEELATVNVELQTKVVDLCRANNDMNNLLAGTGVATLFVDHQLRITRFTPAATQLIKLIQADIGRSVGDIVSNLVDQDLPASVQRVLESLIPVEQEVQTHEGQWFLMRIGPYRTLDNVIEGAVISFINISERKQMENALCEARVLAESIVDAVREPLVVLDQALRVVSVNRAFQHHFCLSGQMIEGRPLLELNGGQWDIPALRDLLASIQASGDNFDDFEIAHVFPQIGPRTMLLNARRLDPGTGKPGVILLVIDDITARPRPARSAPAGDEA